MRSCCARRLTIHDAGTDPSANTSAARPIDVAERPVREQRRDGERGDDEQARSRRRTHRQPEHEEVRGDEQEAAAVREQAGEQADGCGDRRR